MEDEVDFATVDFAVDIDLKKFELAFAAQVLNVRKESGEQVVNRDDRITFGEKSIACLPYGGRLVTCGATSGYDAVTDLRYVWVREMDIRGSDGWTRNDLLRAFLRPDAEIRRDVQGILRRWTLGGPPRIDASVAAGVVTLSGTAECAGDADAVAELIGTVDGVVDVVVLPDEGAGDE